MENFSIEPKAENLSIYFEVDQTKPLLSITVRVSFIDRFSKELLAQGLEVLDVSRHSNFFA